MADRATPGAGAAPSGVEGGEAGASRIGITGRKAMRSGRPATADPPHAAGRKTSGHPDHDRVHAGDVAATTRQATRATTTAAPATSRGARTPAADTADCRLKWWAEAIIVLSYYGVYTAIRNLFGSDLGPAAKQAAIDNAYDMIALERSIHLFGEKGIQDLFIEWDWFIRFWNVFYGSGHFAVTIGVMVLLYTRDPVRYGIWRTVLAVTTALALVGFALYPLMPPRLLNDCGQWGACDLNYSFVDTLKDPGGFWSFGGHAMSAISNQYAAMPSLHIAWAMWCTLAAVPLTRRRWARMLLVCYPWLTLFAVMVTANHYWIDAVGAAGVLGAGYAAGTRLARLLPPSLAPRATPVG